MSHKFLCDLMAMRCCLDNSILMESNCSHNISHPVLKYGIGIYEQAANKFAAKLYKMNIGTNTIPSKVGCIKNLIISAIPDSLRSNSSFNSFIFSSPFCLSYKQTCLLPAVQVWLSFRYPEST